MSKPRTRRRRKPLLRCAIKGCLNLNDEVKFVGPLCTPCYWFLTTERVNRSQASRNFREWAIKYALAELQRQMFVTLVRKMR